jgi:succinate dehydrogenase/fumarate reductase-like Fe-S protein
LCIQNPDTPAEKPKLQSYQIDLNQCGPMLLDALVSGDLDFGGTFVCSVRR